MAFNRFIREAVLLALVSLILGVGVNLSLIKKYLQGEFRQGFLSSEEYPSITFISLGEAEELFARKEAVFIDSRSRKKFLSGHILGAMNFPYEEVKENIPSDFSSFKFEQILVVYCDGDECQSSVELAKSLHKQGFKNIKVFFGGWREWVELRLPASSEDDS